MSQPAVQRAAPAEGLIARWRQWWRRRNELGGLSSGELQRVAGELGLSTRGLGDLAAKGPHAADLLYERLAALGVTKPDADRGTPGLLRDLQRSCSGCNDKAACRKDLASRPDDPVWKGYCPNSVTLQSLSKIKGRSPP
jgi:hypothetical protein